MSLDRPAWLSAALASSWRTTSHARCPSASVTSCTGPSAWTWRTAGTGRPGRSRPTRRAPGCASGITPGSRGSRSRAGRWWPAGRRRSCRRRSACRPIGCRGGPGRAGSGSAAGRGAPRPPTPPGSTVSMSANHRLKRATTASRPCSSIGPPGSSARSRTVPVTAAARPARSRPATAAAIAAAWGWVFMMRSSSRRPARASRRPARWVVSSAASSAAPSIRLDLRRRRNGRPIRYRPGQAVTPPSWTTRPLRSRTGTSSQDRSGR